MRPSNENLLELDFSSTEISKAIILKNNSLINPEFSKFTKSHLPYLSVGLLNYYFLEIRLT